MSRDASHDPPAPNARDDALRAAVRRLVLLKETGPRSAAWHRARVRAIWRLHRALESSAAPRESSDRAGEHDSSSAGG